MISEKLSRRVGLARALSKLGYCSRSDAVDLIQDGRVRLNGAVRRDSETPVRLNTDCIEVNDREITVAAKVYFLLNKPRGIVTSTSDEKGRRTVYGFLEPALAKHGVPWAAPVGRLDKASEGLLLFTNDSEWAALVTAPATHLDKTYHVQIDRVADEALLESLARGIRTKDGNFLRVEEFALCELVSETVGCKLFWTKAGTAKFVA